MSRQLPPHMEGKLRAAPFMELDKGSFQRIRKTSFPALDLA
jgi:hypothetical protein